jgi:hypothetical protein
VSLKAERNSFFDTFLISEDVNLRQDNRIDRINFIENPVHPVNPV